MYLSDFDQAILDSVTPSDLGPVFTEYRNDPEGAIKRLLVEQTGDAKAVWSRPEIGSIDLIWGGDKFGLKKIAKKHPEALEKIPLLLKRGRLIWGEGGGKVFLVDDGNPVHVTVISLSYLGAAKAWILTSYDDTKGRASGILASVDTKKLDSAKMDCRSTVPMLVEILGHDMNSVNIFDNAAPLSALERLKLVKRLLELRNEANGLGKGGAAAMRKLKIVREMIDIRNRLGLGGNATTPEPQATGTVQPVDSDAPTTTGRPGYDTPVQLDARLLKLAIERTRGEPLVDKPAKLEAWRDGTAKTNTATFPIELAFRTDGRLDVNDGRHRIALAAERGETVTAFIDGKDVQRVQKLLADLANEQEQPGEEQNPHVKALQDLAAGKNDGQGLEGMFNIIQGAIDALEAVNPLTGDNEAAAHAAITHWAEFEERLNG